MRKLQVFRAQCDVFKRQLQELQVKVVDETKRADKAAFEAKRSTDKLTTLQREKDVSFWRLRLALSVASIKKNASQTLSAVQGRDINLYR